MTKRMNNTLRDSRRYIRNWARMMRPYAERHLNQEWVFKGEKGFDEIYSDSKTEVRFENLIDFHLSVKLWGVDSEFTYARQVAPYDSDTEFDKNMTLAARLGTPIFECVNSAGFRTRLLKGDECLVSCRGPTIFFFGRGIPDKFEDYIRLVGMTETFLDFSLQSVEKNRERPYKYVIVPYPGRSSFATIISLSSKDNLENAVGILETSKPIYLGDTPMMECSLDEPEVLENRNKDIHAKLISVDDYLQGKGSR